jgi:hypothetical protein
VVVVGVVVVAGAVVFGVCTLVRGTHV